MIEGSLIYLILSRWEGLYGLRGRGQGREGLIRREGLQAKKGGLSEHDDDRRIIEKRDREIERRGVRMCVLYNLGYDVEEIRIQGFASSFGDRKLRTR